MVSTRMQSLMTYFPDTLSPARGASFAERLVSKDDFATILTRRLLRRLARVRLAVRPTRAFQAARGVLRRLLTRKDLTGGGGGGEYERQLKQIIP